ncbi:MAG: hypothetical protein KKE02_14065 [Alphaproteobacteria bacterium]|nr:hypothetical protein [Alphaproteobacteria bacterium]MBU1513011.1 hypothetical protein [Alphaproteobacteria bacterium]MBU2095119.1 hypothetical protein [Alphaproteobacteria bacterium]MBU2152140.1 hypothetical protein [Alphaproteobacteria bacterium]MBU2306370.1 hypothetical protein [Alphaproteobacteria bacterium]
MRTLILNRDLKTLFGGVAVAAAAGLLMGSAMYPDLDAGERAAPQIQMPGGGPRAMTSGSDAGVQSYGGHVPDYVIGTDALKPRQDLQAIAYADQADTGQAADVVTYEAPAQVQPARWQDEPREPTSYPSQRGNVVYTADLPAPPAPPADGDEYPAEN